MTSARERARRELVREIEAAAGEELAAVGAAALSLRAVARRVGLVPSALYRYFASRDALLTALIVTAYDELGAAAESAAGPAPRPGERGADRARLLAVARAVRAWAWEHPHRWALLYGSPVPGYAAPPSTLVPGTRVIAVVATVLSDAHTRDPGGGLRPLPLVEPVPPPLARWVATAQGGLPVGLPGAVVPLAVMALVQLVGGVSVELFGQYGPAATPAPEIFEHNMGVMATLLGLGPTG